MSMAGYMPQPLHGRSTNLTTRRPSPRAMSRREPRLPRRARAAKALSVTRASSLDSDPIPRAAIQPGDEVMILQEIVTPGGVRAFIGSLESRGGGGSQGGPQPPEQGGPHMLTTYPPIGWVTSFVGGHANLITVAERPPSPPAAPSTQDAGTSRLGLAGRIAQRRKERRLESSRERQAASSSGPRFTGSSLNLKRANIDSKAFQARIDSARAKLDPPSVLEEKAAALRLEASKADEKSGEVSSTLASRVGRQLQLGGSNTVEPSKIEELVLLWDRDRNGEISKGEVR